MNVFNKIKEFFKINKKEKINQGLTFYFKKNVDENLWKKFLTSIDDTSSNIFEKKFLLENILNFLIKNPELLQKESTYVTIYIYLNLLDASVLSKEYEYLVNFYEKIINTDQLQKIISLFLDNANNIFYSKKPKSRFTFFKNNKTNDVQLDEFICRGFYLGVINYINELKLKKEKEGISASFMKDINLTINIYIAFIYIYFLTHYKAKKEV